MASHEDYSRSIMAASDELKDIFCEPCEHDGKQSEAEGFCVDCSEYLCGQCYKNHKRHKAFRHHVLQDKDNMPQNVDSSRSIVQDKCLQKCTKHTEEVISFFCVLCDCIGCSTCILLDHRQCTGVTDIPTLVKTRKTQEEIQTFMKKVDNKSQQIQERNNQIESISSTEEDLRKATKTELDQQHAAIIKFFDDLKEETEKKAERIHQSNAEILTSSSKRYKSLDANLTHIKAGIDKKHKDGQNCEAFISMKCLESDMKKVERDLENLQNESKIEIYELIPSSTVRDMMKMTNEIFRLETKTLVLNEGVLKSRNKQKLQMPKLTSGNQFTEKDRRKISLKLEKRVTIANDESRISIKGITEIYEHYIVVADLNNKSIKVIDQRSERIISKITLEGNVWNVIDLNGGKIAVAHQAGIQLLFVSKSGILSKDTALCTGLFFDLANYKGTLVAAQGDKVTIIDMHGKTMKSFNTDSDSNTLFQSCYGVAISRDYETIYVSDYGKNTVTSMTLEGKVKTIYKDNALDHPWGITVDNEGYVYVCSTGTNSIHQLSADCKKIQIIENISTGCITCINKNRLLAGGFQSYSIYEIV